MKTTLAGLCVLCLLMSSCSSDSEGPMTDSDPDNSPVNGEVNGPTTDPSTDPTTGGEPGSELVDDPLSGAGTDFEVDAGNYVTVLNASMDLLRADVYRRVTSLLDEIATQWEPYIDAVVGSEVHECPGGGTVDRAVTEATERSPASIPVFKLVSQLELTDCIIGDVTLNGTVDWNWNQSSPAQLGATTSTYDYTFNGVSIEQAQGRETLTGSYQERISIAGPGDGYRRTSSTQSYQLMQGSETTRLKDASYSQQFDHYIAQQTPANGIDHRFQESGGGTLSISSLDVIDATISIGPELVYKNIETADSSNHTEALASGAIELKLISGSQLNVSVASVENDTVLYTLTDSDGQQTTIERQWTAPAQCRPDEQFNYNSCQ